MTEKELKETIIDCDTCHKLFSDNYDKHNVIAICPNGWKRLPLCPSLYDVVETIKERIDKYNESKD